MPWRHAEDLLRDTVDEAAAELRAEVKTILEEVAKQAAQATDELWPAKAGGPAPTASRLDTAEETSKDIRDVIATLSAQVVTLEQNQKVLASGLKNATTITGGWVGGWVGARPCDGEICRLCFQGPCWHQCCTGAAAAVAFLCHRKNQNAMGSTHTCLFLWGVMEQRGRRARARATVTSTRVTRRTSSHSRLFTLLHNDRR